ncbi:MAG: coenzyme F420-0:L-glutamate ligase [Candidatus Bathyarchaeota archaeon]|nr:coenzyme F420-0:L-glutamate ligase [Candidatus Bathyarchaeota archaeon]
MVKYYALAVTTKYWRPKTSYLYEIGEALKKRVKNGDFVVVSEKAISTAAGNIIDENKIIPTVNSKFLAVFWMKFMWGYFLGVICHFGHRLLFRLREYPIEMGSRHKQVALWRGGLLQALMFGSEGGIDGSNLPYAYVSLPLNDAQQVAEQIRQQIQSKLNKRVTVIVVDTDKTYTFRNFHFTPRPKAMKGIHSNGGVVSYVVGKSVKLRRRSTPLAVAGCPLDAETALTIANVADRARGPGAGATVWDMAARFNVSPTEVSWNMLSEINHKPIVIVRREGAFTRQQNSEN